MSLAVRNTYGQDVFQVIEASEEKAIEIAAEATPLGIKILCFFNNRIF